MGLVAKNFSLHNFCFVCKLYVGSLHLRGGNGGKMWSVGEGMVTILVSRYLKRRRHLACAHGQKDLGGGP